MSTNDQTNGEDERRAARLTAHALGRSIPRSGRKSRPNWRRNPRSWKQSGRSGPLRPSFAALDEAPTPERSAELREAVERRLQELEKASPAVPPPVAKRKPRWSRRIWSLIAVAAALLVFAAPAYFYSASRGGLRPNRKIAATYAVFKPAPLAHGKSAAGEASGPVFESPPLEKFDMGETPEDLSEFNTENQKLEKRDAWQTEEHNDDSDRFENRGGGATRAAKDPRLGGMGGFKSLAYGAGAKVTGKGGLGTGLGTATHPEIGGTGSAFSSRGPGYSVPPEDGGGDFRAKQTDIPETRTGAGFGSVQKQGGQQQAGGPRRPVAANYRPRRPPALITTFTPPTRRAGR